MAAELVTCVMITRASRLALIGQSAACWARQTHLERELLVVIDGCAGEPEQPLAQVEALLSGLGGRARLLRVPQRLPLGALRNLALAEAKGEVLCQWDDDDLFHPQRLETQLLALRAPRVEAVFLGDVFHLFTDVSELYWTSWRHTPSRCHPGTGLWRASSTTRYTDEARGEDLTFCQALRSRGGFEVLAGAPHLYVYRWTGGNAWGREHHAMLAATLGKSRALLLRNEPMLQARLAELLLPAPVEVVGPNGRAFGFAPK